MNKRQQKLPSDNPQSSSITTLGTSVITSETSVQGVSYEYFEGPLPPPEALKRYDKATKGAAARIITMAEKQGKHRRELERKVVESNIKHERIGMMFAFVITMALMTFGAVLIAQGKDIAGYLSFFGPAIFHAGNYLYIRRHQEQTDKG